MTLVPISLEAPQQAALSQTVKIKAALVARFEKKKAALGGLKLVGKENEKA